MKLTDLNPNWFCSGGDGVFNAATGEPVPRRDRIGVSFDCPCGCDQRLAIGFENPPDGGPPAWDKVPTWRRIGDTFETLDLKPSILRSGGCGWHGFVNHGEVVTC